MEQNVELIKQMQALSANLPPPLKREVAMVMHKMTYPMKDILAKVPGDSLTERAKRLKVSRQTMYVWLSEKFRPTLVQAKRIAKFTDVPIEHIVDDGFENDDARKATKRQTAALAKRRRELKASSRTTAPKRRSKPGSARRTQSA